MSRIWVFDFDGTLAPIVPERDAAAMLPGFDSILNTLAGRPGNTVAILSSRTLDDLRTRLTMDGIYLGGASGLHWQSPDGAVICINPEAIERAGRCRRGLVPLLRELLRPYPIDWEDKETSLTIHYRTLAAPVREQVRLLLRSFCFAHRVSYSEGPLALEIRFDASIKKVEGLRALLRVLGAAAVPPQFVFAGDDDNDAEAMHWLIAAGGTAVVVGERIVVPRAVVLRDPAELLDWLREQIGVESREEMSRRFNQ